MQCDMEVMASQYSLPFPPLPLPHAAPGSFSFHEYVRSLPDPPKPRQPGVGLGKRGFPVYTIHLRATKEHGTSPFTSALVFPPPMCTCVCVCVHSGDPQHPGLLPAHIHTTRQLLPGVCVCVTGSNSRAAPLHPHHSRVIPRAPPIVA